MDLVLLFTLWLCWWTAEARSMWSEKPDMIISEDEIKDGESLTITCTLPIDYGGGECRLYRDRSTIPIKVTREVGYLCLFHLSSTELLGGRPVGSTVRFTCNYHLQQYTSVHSDSRRITVFGSSPSPHLSISHYRVLSPADSVEVTCTPPVHPVSSCHYYRDDIHVAQGSCIRTLTGQQLAIWEKPTLLLPVNLTCRYYPKPDLDIRSEPSNHYLVLVLDVSQASRSTDCSVWLEDDQLDGFRGRSWMTMGADGQTLSVQVLNRNLTTNKTWDCTETTVKSAGP